MFVSAVLVEVDETIMDHDLAKRNTRIPDYRHYTLTQEDTFNMCLDQRRWLLLEILTNQPSIRQQVPVDSSSLLTMRPLLWNQIYIH